MAFREVRLSPKYTYEAQGGPNFLTTILESKSGHEDRNAEWSEFRAEFDVSYLLKKLEDDSSSTAGKLYLMNFFSAVALGELNGFRFKWWEEFCADMVDWKNAPAISAGTVEPTYPDTLPLIGIGDGTEDEFQLIKTHWSPDWTITGIITGSKQFKISGNHTAVFTDGVEFQIKGGASGNDSEYTVNGNSTYSSGETVIVVDQTIANGTVQGRIFGPYSYTHTIYKPVPDTVRIWVDGTEKTYGTDFTVNYTTGIITFQAGSIPALGKKVRAWYEYDFPVRFNQPGLNSYIRKGNYSMIDSLKLIELKNF